jgi:hypothetical protein
LEKRKRNIFKNAIVTVATATKSSHSGFRGSIDDVNKYWPVIGPAQK